MIPTIRIPEILDALKDAGIDPGDVVRVTFIGSGDGVVTVAARDAGGSHHIDSTTNEVVTKTIRVFFDWRS